MPEALVKVEKLYKHFPLRKGILSRTVGAVRAVDGLSFSIAKGSTLSLVGESGSGKTTAGRSLLRLIEPSGGKVLFDGVNVTDLDASELRAIRKRMQIIFQDPYGSLNPRMTVYSVLAEAMRAHHLGADRNERRDKVYQLLKRVGLPPETANRYPHEFSGGQRQRIGIARALAVEPEFIVADEPVSALDVSIQAQILNLLADLQAELGLTYLFISHDLSVVRHISDAVAVMYLGRIVEFAPVEKLFDQPVHPYTKALLDAVPKTDPSRIVRRTPLQGDIPSPVNPPAGCHFHPRCPDARPECRSQCPSMVQVTPEHQAACFVHAPEKER